MGGGGDLHEGNAGGMPGALPPDASSTKQEEASTASPSSSSSTSSQGFSATVFHDGTDRGLLTVNASVANAKRAPVDIVCVIDVSGSMGTEATLQNASGSVESHGLSLLDVVKHAVRTVITALGPNDRLSLVSYSNDAELVCGFLDMNDKGKVKAIKEMEKLGEGGSTNLWDGLLKGLTVLKNRSKAETNLGCVFLLTDGLPNIRPPRGEIAMLSKYIDENALPGIIHTFGFGYSLESQLLRDIAREGNGSYVFIPDSAFVGTAFVNAMSNTLVTAAHNVSLLIEPASGCQLTEFGDSGCKVRKTSWGFQVDVPSFQFGQNRDLPFKFSGSLPSNKVMDVTFKFQNNTQETVSVDSASENAKDVTHHWHRVMACEAIETAYDKLLKSEQEEAKNAIKAVIKVIASANTSSEKPDLTLLEDLQGQVSQAVSRDDWFHKWGKHYLISLSMAHKNQQCANFKDPGLQVYGGALFHDIQEKAEQLFVKLPPPKPSVSRSSYGRGAPLGSMASYHCSSNPCFAGSSRVAMADGTTKRVDELSAGMLVQSVLSKKSSARVQCVVKTMCAQGKQPLCEFDSGLLVTPYHPIRLAQGDWVFPESVCPAKERDCEAVYSFVLDATQHHSMIINDIECVTMGHGMPDNDVVSHEYFGTNKVIDDLKQMKGWKEGLVTLPANCGVRDPITKRITKLSQNVQEST